MHCHFVSFSFFDDNSCSIMFCHCSPCPFMFLQFVAFSCNAIAAHSACCVWINAQSCSFMSINFLSSPCVVFIVHSFLFFTFMLLAFEPGRNLPRKRAAKPLHLWTKIEPDWFRTGKLFPNDLMLQVPNSWSGSSYIDPYQIHTRT